MGELGNGMAFANCSGVSDNWQQLAVTTMFATFIRQTSRTLKSQKKPALRHAFAIEPLEQRAMLSIGPTLATAAAAGIGGRAPAAAAPYRTLGDLPAAAQLAISSTVQQEAELTGSDAATADYFGNAVAVSGSTVVVGSPYGNNSYGLAYVFVEPASGWTNMTQVARLTASSRATWSNFGLSVAIDGNTIVVGADSAPGNNSHSGAAFIFTEPASGWTDMTQTATLTASDGQNYDGFGVSVAMSGNTVVVGADGAGMSTGAAYVYTKPATGWTSMSQTAKLTASDGTTYNRLGISVAISGNTIVVGADHNGSSAGAAYVYAKPALGWANMAQTAKLTASDGQSQADFGLSVAVSGSTIVVAAEGADDFKGAAYVFSKPAAGWASMTQTAKLSGSDLAVGDDFGISVTVSGNTVVVGAATRHSEEGAAYVFTAPATGWTNMTESLMLTASDGQANDYFGVCVSINGNTIVVGA